MLPVNQKSNKLIVNDLALITNLITLKVDAWLAYDIILSFEMNLQWTSEQQLRKKITHNF